MCFFFLFFVKTMYLLSTSGGVMKKYFQHYIVMRNGLTLSFPELACSILLCAFISVVVCVFDLLFIFQA